MFSNIPLTKTQLQFARFLIVGGINTLFGYLCFALFLFLGLHYAWAAAFATALGVLFNFNTIGRIVFQDFRYVLFLKFVSIYVLLYALNVLSLKALEFFSNNYYLTGLIMVFPIAMLSFILNKRFVFTRCNHLTSSE